MKKILAVASGGGHWVQLMRLRPAFVGEEVTFMTTNAGYAQDVGNALVVVEDASLWEKIKLVKMFLQVAWCVFRLRPDIVITTGAAPGFAAIVFGKAFGARTIWIDSIANSEELSMSGQKARRWSDVWLTQWEHLARPQGPEYWGGVL
ncbi:UDP-N-acetylglucosamine--LPS N-acetylglucosamine transferase [Aromatoleum diolicum]|uniref:UDP-N-acetylglucosamine--LPS N-acetylglucosamine transferase n=1 Tax=Aromatoleum diolicum TaxID=75796 RepID=A0ABX1QFA9_9RHOO|nr:UDP-N-acetylglucosamine--LPS N-acetylglucosamine transferase [Aromatoleum diolicum]NMG76665.1 UDP-N-acetylglucosamine--LPS N-acetylglucosamine transferase [Aromatoleum diolicum]